MFRSGLFPALSTYLTALLPYTGYEWNRSSPLRSSPDTSSSMYPDRPIRPLPARSLRARLSPEQAESIVFPNNPPSTGPLFNFPYTTSERGNRALRTGENDHHACHCGHTHSEVESEEDEDERSGPLPSSPSYHYSRGAPGRNAIAASSYRKPGSASSSVDGYESFENTNNKKKRKIPNMGSNSSHHTTLSADVASMSIANHENGEVDDGIARYGSEPSTPQHNSGTGIAGAGRGRFGRTSSGRSSYERRVLGNSTSVANAKANKRTVAPREIRLSDSKSPCADYFFYRSFGAERHHLHSHCQRTSNPTAPGQRERQFAASGGRKEQRDKDTVHLHLRL
jgi:hypothetical protein